MDRREFIRMASGAAASVMIPPLVRINDPDDLGIIDYPSPRRSRRPRRKSTDYIVLHTTEMTGSVPENNISRYIRRYGLANYVVNKKGAVYRIMGRHQVSHGCGRSMWDGIMDLDQNAVNIEFVGKHNSLLTPSQFDSGRDLLAELKSLHSVEDMNVMPHSMVAYARPDPMFLILNGYHPVVMNNSDRSRRGRKRCGMLFAKDDIRLRLGLEERPLQDPDVESDRLSIGDPYLHRVLYGDAKIDEDVPLLPRWDETFCEEIESGSHPFYHAGKEYAAESTLYILPGGVVATGADLQEAEHDFSDNPQGTHICVGFEYGGRFEGGDKPYERMGRAWSMPSTWYFLPDGDTINGDNIDPETVPVGTMYFFRK
ncbi:MAG: N-acetylmuramoyl-L-alanine amidase [Candidatus Aenigmatarchaeota archaeon]|nr:MAG: N-acetylmuramoyl-L-alanine amidase [Candidatus Aenigmarchaeota archaeon]